MTENQNDTQQGKAGFAVMVGRSNVGKSTLLNEMVGSKIAITTPKPQTTREPVQGIVTRNDGQVVFVDTPGVFHKKRDALTKQMMESVKHSLEGIDVVLYVIDPTREIGNEEEQVLQMIENVDKPKILVINKMDIRNKPFIDFYKDLSDRFNDVVEVSAKSGTNVGELMNAIFKYLPKGEYFYPEGQMTNMPNDVWLAELIREKLFLRLRQEVPYSTHVEVEEVDRREENDIIYIAATIYTTNDRYKSMIIGKGGRGIKEIGQAVRNELEVVMNNKVYVDLHVDVDPHWVKRYQS
jgi:GTP-binding protein Era